MCPGILSKTSASGLDSSGTCNPGPADDAGGFWPLQPFRNIAAGYRTGAYSGFKRRCICSAGSDETCLGADTLDFPGVWTCTQRSGRNALDGNSVP